MVGKWRRRNSTLDDSAARTEKVLYSFCSHVNCTDGASPFWGLVFDKKGNLYGTTTLGGDPNCNNPYGCGSVFEITSAGTEQVLHSFQDGDGANPYGGLVFDKNSNLYGMMNAGGLYGIYGAVFEITSAGTEQLLHSFEGGPGDGGGPWAGPADLRQEGQPLWHDHLWRR